MNMRPSQYAGFWIRFTADMIDGFIALAFAVPIHYFFDVPVLGSRSLLHPVTWRDMGLSHALLWGFFFYNMTYLVSRTGKSWGRRLLGIAVTDAVTGKPVSFWRALARNIFAGFVSAIFYLGFIWIVWDRRKQAWHDKVFGTVVKYDAIL
jgi:uncharacterized RDD family membrane protein YckC